MVWGRASTGENDAMQLFFVKGLLVSNVQHVPLAIFVATGPAYVKELRFSRSSSTKIGGRLTFYRIPTIYAT